MLWSAMIFQTSIALERAYVRQAPKEHIQVGRWKYEIDLKQMIQVNLKTSKQRQVRRRPTLIS